MVFVNTAFKKKQLTMLKPHNALQEMDDEDESVFCTSPLDRYAACLHELEDMSMAEFAATFITGGQDGPDEAANQIQGVLNGSGVNEAAGND